MVWSVKYRRKVLDDNVSKRLKELAYEICSEKGFTLHSIETGNSDHVHCFISAPPNVDISYIAKMLKGILARRLFMEFPELKKSLWNGVLWNHSYYVETVGSISEENILRYIEKQRSAY